MLVTDWHYLYELVHFLHLQAKPQTFIITHVPNSDLDPAPKWDSPLIPSPASQCKLYFPSTPCPRPYTSSSEGNTDKNWGLMTPVHAVLQEGFHKWGFTRAGPVKAYTQSELINKEVICEGIKMNTNGSKYKILDIPKSDWVCI